MIVLGKLVSGCVVGGLKMPDIKQFLPVEEETLSEAAMWQTYHRGECTEADNFVAGSACTVGLLGLLTVKEVHG